MSSQEQYAIARERVERRIGLAVHWVVFLAVNLGLGLANGFSLTAGYLWGWGIGVTVHTIYVVAGALEFTDRLVDRELQRRPR